MSDSSNICLSCGICCEGVIIGFVEVNKQELSAVQKVMTVEEANGAGFFLQPCKQFCDGCGIYEDRPKNCASYDCGLLKSVQTQQTPVAEALDIIAQAKKQIRAIESKLDFWPQALRADSFYYKAIEVKIQLEKLATPLTPSQNTLMIEMKQLDQLLGGKFEAGLFT